MSETIVWIHPDSLSPTDPALVAHPNAPAIFVWDMTWLQQNKISLKRIQFMYEALLEMPVFIRQGDVSAQLLKFVAEQQATHIATTQAIESRFQYHVQHLRNAQSIVELKFYQQPEFIESAEKIDLKRFSRYWRVAQKYAYEYTSSS